MSRSENFFPPDFLANIDVYGFLFPELNFEPNLTDFNMLFLNEPSVLLQISSYEFPIFKHFFKVLKNSFFWGAWENA